MQFKKGDEIICIDNEGCGKSLTLGKSYTVSSISNFEEQDYVRIINNRWQFEDYFSSRFVLKSPLNTKEEQIFRMFNNIL